MRLKSLELVGFKSFAGRICIDFGEGVTAIVGPNGCGKSNIVDAIRWVLGEQSAKSLRGGEMRDVLFAGSLKRKAAAFAEVSLVLSDVESEFGSSFEEVCITRRLYRDGESEYFFNHKPVRLRDIWHLFFDTGVGKDAFSIFEQGKLDQVINFSPLERRAIFEEAAGIVRFLQQKKEAFKRLEGVDQNLVRLQDILSEVTKQHEILSRQAEEARLYKTKKERLTFLEIALLFAEWEDQSKEKEKANGNLASILARTQEENAKLELLSKTLGQANGTRDKLQQLLSEKREALVRVQGDIEVHQKALEGTREWLEERSKAQIQEEKELEEIALKQAALLEKKNEQQRNLDTQEFEEGRSKKECEQAQAFLQAIEQEFHSLRRQRDSAKESLFVVLKEEAKLDSEWKEKELMQKNAEENSLSFLQRLQSIQEELEKNQVPLQEKEKIKEAQHVELRKKREEIELLEKVLKEIHLKSEEAELLTRRQHKERVELESKKEWLSRLQRDHEGFSQAAKVLLREKNLIPLHTLFDCKEELLPAYLARYEETLLVSSIQERDFFLNFAKKENLSGFSLFCREECPRGNSEEAIAQFFEDPEQDAFGREGFFDRKKVLFIPSQAKKGPFHQRAEIKKLETELGVLQKAIETHEKDKNALKTTHLQKLERKQKVEKECQQLQAEMMENEMFLRRLKSELEVKEKERETLKRRYEEARLSLDHYGKEKEKLALLRLESQKKVTALKENTSDETLLHAKEKELQEKKALFRQKEEQFQKVRETSLHLRHALKILEVEEKALGDRRRNLEEEKKTAHLKQGQLTQEVLRLEKTKEALQDVLSKGNEEKSILEKTLLESQEKLACLEAEKAKLLHFLQSSLEEKHRIEVGVAQLDSSLQLLTNDLQTRFGMSVDAVRVGPWYLDLSKRKAKEEVNFLRDQLQVTSDVNLSSLQACEEVGARSQFLTSQIEDLAHSKRELVQIISQLDEESRVLFRERFEVIRKSFQKTFEILFGGGEADLVFIESGDLLEAGVDIIAKPPGKRMRSISLLSGGEKCMTALALLLAIFETKPSPFCFMDEVDAPLDDINIERFFMAIGPFLTHSQFIFITHNKRTMAQANKIFGVSMQEKGVSTVLALQMSGERAEVAPLVCS